MKPKTDAIVRFDDSGHFEVIDRALIAELGPDDVALVAAGSVLSDSHCNNLNCENLGCFSVNTVCREGKLDVASHGNHQFNVVC